MNNQQLRLNKFLAERLGVSRREADELIASNKITVDGKVAALGTRIDKTNKVCYNKKIVPFDTEFSYLAFHKPVGYVCSRRAQGHAPTIYDLLPSKYHKLKSVGRLDKDSSGLILLTNDGDFAFQMTHPKFRKTKVYEVELDKPLEPLHQQMISDFGVMLDDGPSQFIIIKQDLSQRVANQNTSLSGRVHDPCRHRGRGATPRLARLRTPFDESVLNDHSTNNTYIVKLTEGRNRQIRRTFAALGYKVTKLHRTNFGKYELNDLKPGKYVIIEP